jgi:hypothetical protein
VISASTSGNPVQLAIVWKGIAEGEVITQGSFSSAITGTRSLPMTANQLHRISVSGSFSNLAAGDLAIFKLYRDVSSGNDTNASDLSLIDSDFYGPGIR